MWGPQSFHELKNPGFDGENIPGVVLWDPSGEAPGTRCPPLPERNHRAGVEPPNHPKSRETSSGWNLQSTPNPGKRALGGAKQWALLRGFVKKWKESGYGVPSACGKLWEAPSGTETSMRGSRASAPSGNSGFCALEPNPGLWGHKGAPPI